MQERRQGFAPSAYRPLIALESSAPESEVRRAGAAHNKQSEAPRSMNSLPRMGNAIKLSKILIAHVGNSVCFFHAFFLQVNNKTKKLIK